MTGQAVAVVPTQTFLAHVGLLHGRRAQKGELEQDWCSCSSHLETNNKKDTSTQHVNNTAVFLPEGQAFSQGVIKGLAQTKVQLAMLIRSLL